MKTAYLPLLFSVLCISCSGLSHPPVQDFGEVPLSSVAVSDSLYSGGVETITVDEIKDEINLSDITDSVSYIPLETNKESLFAYINKLVIYKNRIYVMDNIRAKGVFIFDMQGRLIAKIGKRGGAPFEFADLWGMAIDKKNDRLVVADMRKCQVMVYSLDGEYEKHIKIPFLFTGDFDILPSGTMLFATNKDCYNTHLKKYEDYRLLYVDSTGTITRAEFKRDDNARINILYDYVRPAGNEIGYISPFIRSIYHVSDTCVTEKYRIDYKNYPPFDNEEYQKIETMDEFHKYQNGTVRVSSNGTAENMTHLYIRTEGKEQFFTVYDKRSKHSISYRKLHMDKPFLFISGTMYAYEDYMVSEIPPLYLIGLKESLEKENLPVPAELQRVTENLQEDDNPVLVLFKIKEL